MLDRVLIFDTTLRDGEQSPGATLDVQEKVDIAYQLARLGVDIIEAGFPISSPGDFEAVQRIAREVKGVTVCGLARALPQDVDRAAEAVRDAESGRIHVFISSSDIHLTHQIRKTRQEVLEMTAAMVKRAKSYVSDVEFSPMDATRSNVDFLCDVLRVAVEAGATTLNIPDTVGYTVPHEYSNLIKTILERVPGADKVVISVHCHDDLGMAVANSLAAVRAGARQIECTINGIGERAGNCSLEEVVMALRTRADVFGIDTQVDSAEIYKTSRMVSSYTGILVQPNKAIVGANAFAHESGIHQDGVIKDRSTFEIMDAQAVGQAGTNLVLGKHSGRHAFRKRLEELGYQLSTDELNRAFERFKELTDKKKVVSDRDLEALVADEIREQVEGYRLERWQVTCGDYTIPTATVTLVSPNSLEKTHSATGDGPVDAICNAINQIVGVEPKLIEFSLQAVTPGSDAQGGATIRVESKGQTFGGRGASTDIIEASARAYLNAINRLIAAGEDTQKSSKPELVRTAGV